jgi:hypothetical protein
MEPFIMFIEHQDLSGEWHKSGPILIDAKTEKDASVAAVNKANSLFPAVASNVLIRVVSGDSNGRPIAEIRRPQRPNPALGRAVLEQQHFTAAAARVASWQSGRLPEAGPCCLTVTPPVTVDAQYLHCHIPGVIPRIVRDVVTDFRCAGWYATIWSWAIIVGASA